MSTDQGADIWMEIFAMLAPDDLDLAIMASGGSSAVVPAVGEGLAFAAGMFYVVHAGSRVVRLLIRHAPTIPLPAFHTFVRPLSHLPGFRHLDPARHLDPFRSHVDALDPERRLATLVPPHLLPQSRKGLLGLDFERDGIQVLRRRMPSRIPVGVAERMLELMPRRVKRYHEQQKTVFLGMSRGTGELLPTDDDLFSGELFELARDVIRRMYDDAVRRVPALRRHNVHAEIRRTPAGALSDADNRHIDSPVTVVGVSYAPNKSAAGTVVRVVPGERIERTNDFDDYTGGYMNIPNRMVTMWGPDLPHSAPGQLDEDRLAIFLVFRP